MSDRCPNCARLEARVEELSRQVEALTRMVFGQRSEKQRVPDVKRELASEQGLEEKRARAQEKRKANAARRAELPERRVVHDVADEQQVCPKCEGGTFRPLGDGEETVVYDFIQPVLVREVHVRRKYACSCGQHIITADGPPRVIERSPHGPGLFAHAVVSKCADAIPLHRLAAGLKRQGLPVARSTLTDLFHGAADVVRPIARHLMETIAEQGLVQADETPLKIQPEKGSKEKPRKGYMWTFLADVEPDATLVGYRFSESRSGETPAAVLGSTNGTLVVDAYTGYNRVCEPDGRDRAGCWAHVRRKFFELLPSEPDAQEVVDLIRDLYRIEHEARERRIVGSAEHLALRRTRSGPALKRIRLWLEAQHPKHPPRSAFAKAIAYAQNQWDALTRFADDATIPLDNNASERALRIVALGRKNYLFVGHEQAGENLAGLLSLVATCVENDVNPEHYLTDVLLRVQSHPAAAIADLLPHNWKRLFAEETAARLRATRNEIDSGE